MTENQSSQQPYPQNYPPYEDEINLIDYLRVLWRWKWLIIGGTLICAVAAAVMSLQMPKIYEISTVIVPGITGVKSGSGSFIHIDSVANISGRINQGIYDRKIEKTLNLDPFKTRVGFKSAIVKKANLINITSQWKEGDTDLGVKVTEQLILLLSDDYGKIVEQRKGDYGRQILMKQNEISKIETQRKDIDKQILMKENEISKVGTQRKDIEKQITMKENEISRVGTQRKDIEKQIKLKLSEIEKIRNKIKLQQATLGNIEQRRGELLEEIKGVKENTEKIVQQRDALLKGKNPDKDISLLLYSTTIQQNVAYFNQLSNQIYNLGTSEKKIEAEVDKLSKNIDDIKTGIERLNLNKTEGLQAKIDDIKTEIEKMKLQKTEGLQTEIDDIKTEIEKMKLQKTEGLQTGIDDIKAEINTLSLEKGLISNIKVVQEPEVSLSPVKPKKKQIVLLSGVVALFMFVFLAFFIEYIKRMRGTS